MSDHSDLDYDRPPPLRTIDRLEAENAKLRAEVKRLEGVKSVYRLEAFDLQATLRTVDLQNREMKDALKTIVKVCETDASATFLSLGSVARRGLSYTDKQVEGP